MWKKALTYLGVLSVTFVFAMQQVAFAQAADYQEVASISDFGASKGDYLIFDLENGLGYLINDIMGLYVQFPIMSGQQRFVYYLGRSYFAATPEKTWEAKEKSAKGDRVTFGKRGVFLRLYDNGKRTSYGIHNYKYFDTNIEKDVKYLSMGCILVADDVLTVLEKSFEANGNLMKVITKKIPELPF